MFCYEISWARRDECHVIIKDMQKNPAIVTNKLMATTTGLQRFKDKLTTWSKKTFSNQKGIISSKLEQIQHLQNLNQGDLTSNIK